MAAESVTDYDEMGARGLYMMLNNDIDGAETFFKSHKDESPLMMVGLSCVRFLKGTLEEDNSEEVIKGLQETQKQIEHDLKKINKMAKKNKHQETGVSLEDRIQREVVLADTMVFQATLLISNSAILGYVKAAWLGRKAWKIYERNHKLIRLMQGQKPRATKVFASDDNKDEGGDDILTEISLNEESVSRDTLLSEATLSKLLGAVNFGYGLFELWISMSPEKVLRLMEFLGFEGDEQVGLDAIDNCIHSKDMRSPMAVMMLLWYRTLIKPLITVDVLDKDEVIREADAIINEYESKFSKSAIFMHCKAKVQRLKKDPVAALSTYNYVMDLAGEQKELRQMVFADQANTHMTRSNWKEAIDALKSLQEETKVERNQLHYFLALCYGSMGDMSSAQESFKTASKLKKRKGEPMELFVLNRCHKMKKKPPNQEQITLMALEQLYLWFEFQSLPETEIKKFIAVCNDQTEKSVASLKWLLKGALYRQLNDEEIALQCLQQCITDHEGVKDDQHIPAFASFEMACLYLQKPETVPKARALLVQLKDSPKEHNFDEGLDILVKSALKVLDTRHGDATDTGSAAKSSH